jgi:hypothetical protein
MPQQATKHCRHFLDLSHDWHGLVCHWLDHCLVVAATLLTLMETVDVIVVRVSALHALIVGILLSNLVFRALLSSVDSVIVSYAEASHEFQRNHPYLAQEMQDTWCKQGPISLVERRLRLKL